MANSLQLRQLEIAIGAASELDGSGTALVASEASVVRLVRTLATSTGPQILKQMLADLVQRYPGLSRGRGPFLQSLGSHGHGSLANTALGTLGPARRAGRSN